MQLTDKGAAQLKAWGEKLSKMSDAEGDKVRAAWEQADRACRLGAGQRQDRIEAQPISKQEVDDILTRLRRCKHPARTWISKGYSVADLVADLETSGTRADPPPMDTKLLP